MGRPRFEVTETSRRTVKSMTAFGSRHEDIATVLGITPKTLRKHFRRELDRGAIEANAKVMQSLYLMATTGKSAAAAIFWAKTRCGLQDGTRKKEEAAPAIVVKVAEGVGLAE